MSLTIEQEDATRHELAENLTRSGLTINDLAQALKTTPAIISATMDLDARHIEDPWIIATYLQTYMQAHHQDAVPYTALKGDYHHYWFLNAKRIERGVIK
ncbi:DUF2316 family protein [Secundilactobacillus folii]|uniref:DUF2316 family protein n=1 Tax=Secundilactobacillus folii TaxID=2678357 RepID=A0A7X2XVE0_9LACO|nr:DUF2316 family protein [Secundilactobacillus folii]MTV82323.1 DUF2316 family protein [Secundilactobacillus folii]